MGVKERKEREYKQRKENILKAAEKIIFKKGLDATTIEEIAEEAELAKGTIYRYFRNKDELILSITLKAARIFNSIGKEQINSCENTWEKILAAIHTYTLFYRDYPDYFSLFFMWDTFKIDFASIEPGSIQEEYFIETNKMHSDFREAFEQGINEGSIRMIDNPQKTLFVFMTTLFGYFRTLVTRMELIEKRFGYDFDGCLQGLIVLMERTFKT